MTTAIERPGTAMMLNAPVENLLLFVAILLGPQNLITRSFPMPSSLSKNDPAADCLIAVILQTKPQNAFLICRSPPTFCPWTVLNYFLESPWTWTVLDNAGNMADNVKIDDVCVITAKENEQYDMLAQLGECHRARILLMFPSDVAPINLDNYEPFFGEAWQLGLVDIVIVLHDRFHCFAYTYIPFRPNGRCNDTSPILLDSWKSYETRSQNRKTIFFPENKVSNLHYCDFTVTVMANDYIIFSNHVQLMQFLEKALNSTLLFERSVDSNLMNISRTSRGAVAWNGAFTPTTLKFLTPSFFYTTIDVLLVIPVRPISSVGWSRLLKELSTEIWYGVFLSCTVSVVAFCVFLKRERFDFGFALLFTISPLLGASCPKVSFRWQAQLYFGLWLMFGLTLGSTYLCTLKSNLIAPFSDDAIKTFSDFVESGIQVYAPPDVQKFMNLPLNSPYEPLKGKIIYDNVPTWYMYFFDLKDVAYLAMRDHYEWYFMKNTSYRILPDEIISRSLGAVFMTTRPSPFERRFNTALLRAAGAGAIALDEHRRQSDGQRQKRESESLETERIGPPPLTLKSLSVIFGLLLIGFIVGLVLFVAEHRCSRLQVKSSE